MIDPKLIPPYPKDDSPLIAGLVGKILKEFEDGRLSVAGAIRSSIVTAWALGHADGEDICLGCQHRAIETPKRSAPHLECLKLSMTLMLASVTHYVGGIQRGVPFPMDRPTFDYVMAKLSEVVKQYPDLAEAFLNRVKEQRSGK